MPAAAVIPAQIAYTKVGAVKKLVVGFLAVDPGPPREGCRTWFWSAAFFEESASGIQLSGAGSSSFTVSKIECSKQAFTPLNTLAWNNKIRPWSILLVCTPR